MKTALLLTLAIAPAVDANAHAAGAWRHVGHPSGPSSHFTAAGRECSLGFVGPVAGLHQGLRADGRGPKPEGGAELGLAGGKRGALVGRNSLFGRPGAGDKGHRAPPVRLANLRGSSVIKEHATDPTEAIEKVLRGVPQATDCCCDTAPSSLPFLVGGNDEDAILNGGVKVGHGIRLSVYPKQVVSSGQKTLSEVVSKLHHAGRATLSGSTVAPAQLDFTFHEVYEVRDELADYHTTSERKLSAFGQLLTERFTGGGYETTSVVTARSDADGGGMGQDVFTLTQSLTKADLVTSSSGGLVDSYQLATAQLAEMSVEDEQPVMVDHALEYQAEEWNEAGVHRVIAHARPRHDLWKVLADSLFGLDELIPNRGAATDMYHLKIVVEDEEHAEAMHRSLRQMEFTDAELLGLGLSARSDTRTASLIEQSTHTAGELGHMVAVGTGGSGDRSSVIQWYDSHFLVRVQTLNEHYAETEMISATNRERMAICKEIQQERLAVQSPLYGFARNFLEWMLTSDSIRIAHPPSCSTIKVSIS
mmetsp:Transcript_26605/g.67087  ORF Transcript_26605/g.67087 Transcript_26605/m.67087 type:complete len:533 (-) Transcript_26605:510-2108(-)